MNKKILILAIGLILMSQLNIFSQSSSVKFSKIEFDTKSLSQSGKSAYETLLTTEVFTLSGYGVAAAPYPQTVALSTLLSEKNAEKALQSIIRNSPPAGQVYGLLGLQVIKSKEFKSDFKVFRNLFSEQKNQSLEINSSSGGCGPFEIKLKRIDVINDLEKGSLVKIFRLRFPQPK